MTLGRCPWCGRDSDLDERFRDVVNPGVAHVVPDKLLWLPEKLPWNPAAEEPHKEKRNPAGTSWNPTSGWDSDLDERLRDVVHAGVANVVERRRAPLRSHEREFIDCKMGIITYFRRCATRFLSHKYVWATGVTRSYEIASF